MKTFDISLKAVESPDRVDLQSIISVEVLPDGSSQLVNLCVVSVYNESGFLSSVTTIETGRVAKEIARTREKTPWWKRILRRNDD